MKETEKECVRRLLEQGDNPCQWCASATPDDDVEVRCTIKGCKKFSKFEFCTDYDCEVF